MAGLQALSSKEDVTFAQLRMFVQVARSGSFAQAADELDITQAAVSYQIKALEDRLHRQLFHRQRGAKAVITEDGSDALETVIRILEHADDLFISTAEPDPTIKVRIATGAFLIEECLRPIIPQIHQQCANIEIEAIQDHSRAIAMKGIVEGTLDIAIFTTPLDDDPPRHPHLSWELPMILVAKPGIKRQLDEGSVSLETFPFIFPTNKERGGRWAKRCMREMGITSPLPPLFSEFVDVIGRMVEDGSGIGYVGVHHVAKLIKAGVLETLDIPLPPLRRIMIRSPHAPAVAEKIEEMICDVLAATMPPQFPSPGNRPSADMPKPVMWKFGEERIRADTRARA